MEEKRVTAISNSRRDHIKLQREDNEKGTHETEQRALCEQIFQKELTQIDVGKLNRLVIPKKHALACFSLYPNINSGGDEEAGEFGAFRLPFFEKQIKLWKFGYCYWKSRESFVLTKGWYRFVKDNELKTKDIVAFYRCGYRDDPTERRFCVIDILKYKNKGNGSNGKDQRGEEHDNNGVRLFGVKIS